MDSETSSLRVLQNGEVKTLIGSGLFDFGFKDGARGKALLQHPIGVFADAGGVYIADSYNHSIRRYDPASGRLQTILGNGQRGGDRAPKEGIQFNEPNDVLVIGEKIWVADTNNHRIVSVDPVAKTAQALAIPAGKTSVGSATYLPNLEKLPVQNLKPRASLSLSFSFEPGWKVNDQAPSSLSLFAGESNASKLVKKFSKEEIKTKSLSLPPLAEGIPYRLQATV
ncbi:MAG: hypothetical protein ACREP8_16305, partial [Candidatus Binatia bacterium]